MTLKKKLKLLSSILLLILNFNCFAQDEGELAKKAQNPVGDLISIPFQNNTSSFVHQYNLGTAWDVTSAQFYESFDVTSETILPIAVFFTPDESIMYTLGFWNDTIFQYEIVSDSDVTDVTDPNNNLSASFQISGDGTLEELPYSGEITQELTFTTTCIP